MSVQLQRGERLELTSPRGGELSHIALALEVDPSSGAGVNDDVEFACALLDGNRNVVDVVHPMRQASRDSSTRHCGGRRISIHLPMVSASVQHILLVAIARGTSTFATVRETTLQVFDRTGDGICNTATTGGEQNTALVLARLYRENADWKILPLGVPATGRTLDAVLHQVRTTC